MPPPPSIDTVFPFLSHHDINAALTSSWYDKLEDLTIPAVFIDLEEIGEKAAFLEWLNADSIFLPEDSEGQASTAATSNGIKLNGHFRSDSVSSNASSSTSSSASTPPKYYLPKTNQAIREAISRFGGAVFPKLNWTSPRDGAAMIPQGSHGPCYCQTPADVYLLLKSSNLIHHGLDHSTAYESGSGPSDQNDSPVVKVNMKLELALKKFVEINPAMEFRCFIKDDVFVGISQRDMNTYDHLQSAETQDTIRTTIREFWEDEIRGDYDGGNTYIFDILLSEKYDKCTLIDFNSYRSSTESLLWTYEDLHQEYIQQSTEIAHSQLLRVIDSPAHPGVNGVDPAYRSNMMPVELMEMGQGMDLQSFTRAFAEMLQEDMRGGEGDDSD